MEFHDASLFLIILDNTHMNITIHTNNRGQISIFLLLGIVILALFFWFISVTQTKAPVEPEPVLFQTLPDCLRDISVSTFSQAYIVTATKAQIPLQEITFDNRQQSYPVVLKQYLEVIDPTIVSPPQYPGDMLNEYVSNLWGYVRLPGLCNYTGYNDKNRPEVSCSSLEYDGFSSHSIQEEWANLISQGCSVQNVSVFFGAQNIIISANNVSKQPVSVTLPVRLRQLYVSLQQALSSEGKSLDFTLQQSFATKGITYSLQQDSQGAILSVGDVQTQYPFTLSVLILNRRPVLIFPPHTAKYVAIDSLQIPLFAKDADDWQTLSLSVNPSASTPSFTDFSVDALTNILTIPSLIFSSNQAQFFDEGDLIVAVSDPFTTDDFATISIRRYRDVADNQQHKLRGYLLYDTSAGIDCSIVQTKSAIALCEYVSSTGELVQSFSQAKYVLITGTVTELRKIEPDPAPSTP
jgi:hypothetical protein